MIGAVAGMSVLLAWMACLPTVAAAPREKKVVFIAGKKSHGPGEHEYEQGCRLLAGALERATNAKGFKTEKKGA